MVGSEQAIRLPQYVLNTNCKLEDDLRYVATCGSV